MSISRELVKSLRIALALMLGLMVIFTSTISAFAATPATEEIDYEGKGVVDVEFRSNVNWNAPKVTVTDASGKKYTAVIIKKDNDDISFRINNFKTGTKYNFAISGVKKAGTTGYGTINGTVTIPAPKTVAKKTTVKTTPAKKVATTITSAKAKTLAINNAVASYKAIKTTMRDFDVEKDTFRGATVWEVSFEAKRTGLRGIYEFEFKIDAKTGKIVRVEVERD